MISPLDWGLGHASRCIPIIKYLLEKGHKVIVAGSGLSLELLQQNFKDEVVFVNIPGYNISYAKGANTFAFKVLQQVPHILQTIQSEHKLVQQLVQQFEIDAIISDNRYGVYHRAIPSVFMTHQYQILSGSGTIMDKLLLKLHESRMQRFQSIWIVDEERRQDALVCKLSHPISMRMSNVEYIGHLSQLESAPYHSSGLKRILLLLSGPEPARTQLYQQFLEQAIPLDQYSFVIITGSNLPIESVAAAHIQQYGLSDQTFIQSQLQAADMVVCRSGYSTIMDLIAVQQKALLIPTPGQTEQEYVADSLKAARLFASSAQSSMSLTTQLSEAYALDGFTQGHYGINETFKKSVDALLLKCIVNKDKKNSDS